MGFIMRILVYMLQLFLILSDIGNFITLILECSLAIHFAYEGQIIIKKY